MDNLENTPKPPTPEQQEPLTQETATDIFEAANLFIARECQRTGQYRTEIQGTRGEAYIADAAFDPTDPRRVLDLTFPLSPQPDDPDTRTFVNYRIHRAEDDNLHIRKAIYQVDRRILECAGPDMSMQERSQAAAELAGAIQEAAQNAPEISEPEGMHLLRTLFGSRPLSDATSTAPMPASPTMLAHWPT